MSKKTVWVRKGFTLIELVIGLLMASVLTVTLAVVLMDSQRGWNYTYGISKKDIAIDDHIAKLTFDSVIRKGSAGHVTVGSLGQWVETCYYAAPASTELDRYCRLYRSDESLIIEHGQLDPKEASQSSTVCGNVADCLFTRTGRSVQMVLTLVEESTQKTIVSSAYVHNE
jgi:prepilin-type N-terminal cleavage/methylation domain-containing protein